MAASSDSNPESLESLTATKFMSCAELWCLDSFPRPLILSALPFSSFVQKLIRDYFPRINVIRGQENYTDRNPVRSLLEFSTKAAFPSTTLESLVLDWEVK